MVPNRIAQGRAEPNATGSDPLERCQPKVTP